MIKEITKFFNSRLNIETPILLAFSGGPDSLALLYLLLEYGKDNPVKIAIAHVDHGWREESRAEALEIAALAAKFELPFHILTLDPKMLKGNLEAACREKRLQFFSLLCDKYGYQAVLLAHHADDVAETVLKRALEGAALPCLAGMKAETVMGGMKVWRPLLTLSKTEILQWLEARNLRGFDDKTNLDPKYLRARFRLSVLPYLSEMFGKEISSGLCRISKEAEELGCYLDEKVKPYFDKIVTGKFGSMLDLSENCPNSIFELKHLIRQFCKCVSFSLSRECLVKAAEFLKENKANKLFVSGHGDAIQNLYIDRQRLFFPLNADVKWGHITSCCDSTECVQSSDWRDIWLKGRGEVVLPEGHYELALPTVSLTKWWTDHKVPAFFRMNIPVILKNGSVVHEFLTGKRLGRGEVLDGRLVKITIETKS